MVAVFDVLSDANRRRILDLLVEGERAVGDLVAALDVSQPAVSKHLRVLRGAGLVEARVDAQRRLYRIRLEPLRQVDDWLAPYRAQWSARLDALETHLEGMGSAPRAPEAPNAPNEANAPTTGRKQTDAG